MYDRACAESGLPYLRGTQIDQAPVDRLIERAHAYFALDHDAKMKNYIGLSENHSGYVPVGEKQFGGGSVEFKESYDINYDYPLKK